MPESAVDTIYIPLQDDLGWVPVQASRRAGGVFQILSRNDDPASEPWRYPSGSLVRCEVRPLARGECLVAVALVPPPGLKVVRNPGEGRGS